jgi:gustatory receptor
MTLHRSIAWTLLVGQILGLMPISGIFNHDESNLKFQWKSLRFCYTIIIFIGSILYVVYISSWMIKDKISLNSIITAILYISNLLNAIIFFRLGIKWSELIKLWRCLQLSFPSSSFVIQKNSLKWKMNFTRDIYWLFVR